MIDQLNMRYEVMIAEMSIEEEKITDDVKKMPPLSYREELDKKHIDEQESKCVEGLKHIEAALKKVENGILQDKMYAMKNGHMIYDIKINKVRKETEEKLLRLKVEWKKQNMKTLSVRK